MQLPSILRRSARIQAKKELVDGAKLEAPPPVLLTFDKFGELPTELQDLVWEFAVAGTDARVVKVRPVEDIVSLDSGDSYICRIDFTSPSPVPALLHVCHGSRQLAAKRWKRSFASTDIDPKIWFDDTCDTLYFSKRYWNGDMAWDWKCGSLWDFTHPGGVPLADRPTRIMLDAKYEVVGQRRDGLASMGRRLTQDFPGLVELKFVYHDPADPWPTVTTPLGPFRQGIFAKHPDALPADTLKLRDYHDGIRRLKSYTLEAAWDPYPSIEVFLKT